MKSSTLLPLLQERDLACVWCGRGRDEYADWSVEHVLPTSRGGGSGIANLALACSGCNHARKSHPAADYAIKIARRVGAPTFTLLYEVFTRMQTQGTAKEREYARKQSVRLQDWDQQYQRWGMN